MGRPVFHLGRYRESRRGLSRPGDCPDFRAAKMGLSPSARVTPYDVVRIVLGLILLTAAALKGHQLATGPVAETSLFTSRWFLICVVEFELFFGLWLLSGLYPRRTWQAALVCFSAFACVSLYKALSGEATCGCFGRVPVSPWYTLILDLAAAVALVLCRPARGTVTSPLPLAGEGPGVRAGALLFPLAAEPSGLSARLRRRLGWVLGIFLAAGIPGALAMGTYHAPMLDDSGDIFGDSQFVVLKPDTWVGRRFPLIEQIEVRAALGEGDWLVLLFHKTCPACRMAIIQLQHLRSRPGSWAETRRIALVEVPPFGNTIRADVASPDPRWVYGRLRAVKEWFVKTPIAIVLKDGEVVATVEDFNSRMWAMESGSGRGERPVTTTVLPAEARSPPSSGADPGLWLLRGCGVCCSSRGERDLLLFPLRRWERSDARPRELAGECRGPPLSKLRRIVESAAGGGSAQPDLRYERARMFCVTCSWRVNGPSGVGNA